MLYDAGMVRREFGGMGDVVLGIGWREINDWMTCTRQDVSATWLRGMIWLSSEVAAQIEASREISCKAPFDPSE